MSIRALTNLAVERDVADPGTPAKGGPGGVDTSFVDALTSAIPTEPLAAYTAAIAVVAGLKTGEYLPFRWGAFVLFLALTAASIYISYVTKDVSSSPQLAKQNKRSFPVIETVAAIVAAVAWGLAMPGSALNTLLKGNDGALAAAAITITGAAVLSLLAPWLTKGSKPPSPAKAAQPTDGPTSDS
jgi:hypothetical protein